ncbi:sugar phosphate isomerase/epimerase family protein [Ruania alba]|uniref:Inosose dehydratase n=1 Tax=Ruania alba TaxID=648782 RepID=A0A1H5LLJ9_9MICO|nr:sugar phosphate isomerase/epimerase [Ruania alba]SEE77874.1 inosose dehydratase [Ruania alba]
MSAAALCQHPVAVNPLQFLASRDGWFDPSLAPPREEVLEIVAGAGFTAVQPDLGADEAVSNYAHTLGQAGLRAGPGYLSLDLSDDPAQNRDTIARARVDAARLAELGSPLAFLSLGTGPGHPRFDRPAHGHSTDGDRTARARDLLVATAEAAAAEGLVTALHPHVGSWVETESEIDEVLASGIGFGPDLGHLAWAGADVCGVLTRHRAAIAGVHVKDYDLDLLTEARTNNWDYRRTTAAGVWREPGTGDAPLEEALDVLPSHVWIVVEVDWSVLPPVESVRRSASWVTSAQHHRTTTHGHR